MGKKRALKVKINEEYLKWVILKKAKNLKEDDNESIKNIIIAPDMTKMEREENNALIMELRERKKEGGRWTIRNKTVVKIGESRQDHE